MNCSKNFKQGADKKNNRGASLVEYGLLVGLIAALAIGALSFLGKTISANFSNVASAVTGTAN